MPTTTFELAIYLLPVLTVCATLFAVIVKLSTRQGCARCGGPVEDGETFCAACRTAGNLSGLPEEQWLAGPAVRNPEAAR